MIKICYPINLLVILMFFSLISETKALDIPAYIEDPQDTSGNIEIIVKENTPIVKSSEDAEAWEQKSNEMLRQYATQLYADAISTRANMMGSSSPESDTTILDGVNLPGQAGAIMEGVKSIFKKLSPISQDNISILQNEVKDYNKNIALRLKQIANLEAEIANLKGFLALRAFNTSFAPISEEDE